MLKLFSPYRGGCHYPNNLTTLGTDIFETFDNAYTTSKLLRQGASVSVKVTDHANASGSYYFVILGTFYVNKVSMQAPYCNQREIYP